MGEAVTPLFLNPNEADFLSLFSSSPLTPQSSFPVGELQSERVEDTLQEGLEGEDRPRWWVEAPRSMKLWLRLVKAADLEFITAAATAADESNPKAEGFLTGEEGMLDG
ncbi:hypothetical protein V8G54_035384 [Vigna mungo]|uniref:Uncharacterized protein n=1 Tax=Vigna mungo TaxID=3915 RepID=A0AAQ3MFC9_VIGMU